ncbi:MAG: hypothetical protein Kow0090_21640 [Myxococcota bacterium]
MKLYIRVLILATATLFYGYGCADIEPPRILDTTILKNTADSLGPYEILATVSDDREIRDVHLYFGGGNDETPEAELARRKMEKVSDETYRAEIPGFPVGSTVIYFIVAQDMEGNIARDPPSGYFSFRILSSE